MGVFRLQYLQLLKVLDNSNFQDNKVHPHKFRRTLATVAIDKGMPIEQLQQLLGHRKIDTTLQYAMSGHNLMQAIARVNRVFRDKEGGLVVDYVGIASALKQAMKQHSLNRCVSLSLD